MPENAAKQGERDEALDAMNDVMEAFMDFLGPKEARRFLRSLASRAASDPANVVRLGDTRGPRRTSWVYGRLPHWMAKHG